MANTYSSLFYHLVFSTKERRTFLKPSIENRVWDFIGGIARHNGLTPIKLAESKIISMHCCSRRRSIRSAR
ncbi:MAG: transposase [Acidobacteriota bacterium]|nr:MAG: transposase [Acidobacteriota bacterium]